MLPNGEIKVIDRAKNVIKLAQGEFVSPPLIENTLLLSPMVDAIFVHGDSLRSFVVAIVVPNPVAALSYLNGNNSERYLSISLL